MPEYNVSDLRKSIRWLGFNPVTGQWGIQVFVFMLVVAFLIINSILYVIYKWDDVETRLTGVKALVLYLMAVTYVLGLTTHWNDTMLLVETTENGFYKSPYNTSKNEALKRSIESNIATLRWLYKYVLIGYTASVYLAPAVVFIYRVTQNSIGDITVAMLLTTLPFYYPENYETIPVFIVAYLCQGHLFMYGTKKGFVVFMSAFNSMQMIAGELRILRHMLEEMDSITDVRNSASLIETATNDCTKSINQLKIVRKMNVFFQCFVNHHMYIQRKVEEVTKGMTVIAFSYNSGISVLLCTSIYSMARTNNTVIILNEALYCITLTVGLFFYALVGEMILTEDDKLRTALYECTWTNKPLWFKKSLLLIMTRTTKPIEMKASVLFTLNLRTALTKLQAAYSYFNILNSLR